MQGLDEPNYLLEVGERQIADEKRVVEHETLRRILIYTEQDVPNPHDGEIYHRSDDNLQQGFELYCTLVNTPDVAMMCVSRRTATRIVSVHLWEASVSPGSFNKQAFIACRSIRSYNDRLLS